MYVFCVVLCVRATEHAFIYTSGSEFRQFSFDLVESRWFNVAILIVIFINTVAIGIQTSTYVVAKAGKHMTMSYLMIITQHYQTFLAI